MVSAVRCRPISNKACLMTRDASHCVVFTGCPLVAGLACSSASEVVVESGDGVRVGFAEVHVFDLGFRRGCGCWCRAGDEYLGGLSAALTG